MLKKGRQGGGLLSPMLWDRRRGPSGRTTGSTRSTVPSGRCAVDVYHSTYSVRWVLQASVVVYVPGLGQC